jgi:Integrase core domain
MAENRQLYGLVKAQAEPKEPKPHPFKATFRHEIWSLDIRYIEKHQIPELTGPFYVISVMDNFSRAILASDIYQAQDLASVLIVLYAAIEQHGCPHRLVTDNGSVFRAKQAMAMYEALEIQKEWIHKKQSWENLIESHFSIMRRMSNDHFEQITSWEGAKQTHRRFVEDYNHQPHWGHRKRDDHRHTPAEVLGWVTGKMRTPEQLHRIFYATRGSRAPWIASAMPAFVGGDSMQKQDWPDDKPSCGTMRDALTLEYANAPLSQYTVDYQPDKKHFRRVREPRHFQTPYQSPQEPLWEPDAVEWYPAQRLPDYAPRRSRKYQTGYVQAPLLDGEQTRQA